MDRIWEVCKNVFGGNDDNGFPDVNIATAKLVAGVLTVTCVAVAVLAVLALAGICPLFGGLLASTVGLIVLGASFGGAGVAGIATYAWIVIYNWDGSFLREYSKSETTKSTIVVGLPVLEKE
ncbi:MAG: hypothetical protein LBT98_02060 [Puniceicoccales bacterium]|jgi:hypothetical protein|nr:hypothetical protein [Puniceicoccales bacterium]